MGNPKRYFILTPGRTGSTRLADCGARFGMPAVEGWDRETGEFEHRLATKATRYTMAMRRHGYWPPPAPTRYLYLWHRWVARRKLAKALLHADFVKVAHGHTLLGPALALGYEPAVILSIREFAGYAVSTARKDRGVKLFEDICGEFIDTLQNGVMAIRSFGGCIVDYRDLTDPAETAWAEHLSATIGIAADRLLAARRQRLGPAKENEEPALRYAEAERVYEETRRSISLP